jgi:hypothetical protein
MTRLLGLAGVLLLALTACGGYQPVSPAAAPPTPVPPSPTVTITRTFAYGDVEAPPPFHVRYGDTELLLHASTFCYTSSCVDGWDDDPPSVGSPEEIFVFVPVREFGELQVGQTEEVDDDCAARRTSAEAVALGDGWWRIRPRGPAGSYRLSIFAGGGGGDMIGDVRWVTPYDQPLPDPTARLALIADHDGHPDSYGLELAVSDLPASPVEYAATITVTAGNGRSLTFDATPAQACPGEGAIFFDGPAETAKEAAALGDFPFTTIVALTLDGVTYTATATYPDDEIEGSEPSVALEFEPPLPR